MTVDLAAGERTLGGTVSYAAPTYAAFGHRVGIVTSAARNEPLLEELRPFSELAVVPSEQTLTYENVYSESGRRQYVRATASPISVGDIPGKWKSARCLHLGPLAGEINPLEIARGFPNAMIMLTPQGMMRRWDEDGLVKFRPWFDENAFRLIDIVIYSEEDVRQLPLYTEKLRKVSRHLVVTNGSRGGTYYGGGEAMRYDSIAVDARDLTGAGDVFAASLLGSLPALNGDVASAVRLAARLAACSVTRSGLASAPTTAEIAAEMLSSTED